MVGGTAIALQIGHRRSIDFDLFKYTTIRHRSILNKIETFNHPYLVTRRVSEQLSLIVHNVKFTFYEYPFKMDAAVNFDNILRMPVLLDLAAMKAYALGRRSKWKDYADIFFLLKDHFSIKEIVQKANILYGQLFSEKLFRAQLSYFDDIDYTEPIEYLVTPAPDENEIRNFLIDKATDLFD